MKFRKTLANLFNAQSYVLPEGHLVHYRKGPTQTKSLCCHKSREKLDKILRNPAYEIALPVSILLPLVSLYLDSTVSLHTSLNSPLLYRLPRSLLSGEEELDLLLEDALLQNPISSIDPALFALPDSADPFSSFTADPRHPRVLPWHDSSTLPPSFELSLPDFDPFASLALPDSSRSTSRTISSRSRRSEDTTPSQTRTEKAAQVPRTTRDLTPDLSTPENRTQSNKRSRGREEEGSEDGESVRKVRKVACSEACLAARELEKLEWEQERTTLKQIQERSQRELERMEEELRRARAEKQNVQDQLDASYRSLTVLGVSSSVELNNLSPYLVNDSSSHPGQVERLRNRGLATESQNRHLIAQFTDSPPDFLNPLLSSGCRRQ